MSTSMHILRPLARFQTDGSFPSAWKSNPSYQKLSIPLRGNIQFQRKNLPFWFHFEVIHPALEYFNTHGHHPSPWKNATLAEISNSEGRINPFSSTLKVYIQHLNISTSIDIIHPLGRMQPVGRFPFTWMFQSTLSLSS